MTRPVQAGIYGYGTLVAACLVAFAVLPIRHQTVFAAGVLLYAGVCQRPALSRMVRWPLLIFGVMVITVSAVTWSPDLGWRFTVTGCRTGALLLLRGITVITAIQILAVNVSIMDLARLLDAAGIRGLGFTVGTAFHMLPLVHELAGTTYHAMRLRGAFHQRKIRGLKLWVTTVILQVLRRTDVIVAAARTRAMDPELRKEPVPALSTGDIRMMGIITGLIILLAISARFI